MNNFFKQLKVQSKRVLIAAIIGVSLWSMSAPAYAVEYQKGERGIQATERYDQIQKETDGMNTFEDTDPRRNTARAEAKARELSDVAERRSIRADDPLEPTRETIRDIGDSISDAGQDIIDRVQD